MRDIDIVLGGLERSYMQRLALYLKGRMSVSARIDISDEKQPDFGDDSDHKRIWIGSEEYISLLPDEGGCAGRIVLSEYEDERENYIMRYQPADRLYRQLMAIIRELSGYNAGPGAKNQKWLLLTTDGPVCEMAAFSFVCALTLAGHGNVLHINMSECSGEYEWGAYEADCDIGDYILKLRKDKNASPHEFACRIETADCIMPPFNPMILQEMGEEDSRAILESVRTAPGYDWVVIALGSTFAGCDGFIAAADRLFHITAGSYAGNCSKKEWLRFIRQCRGREEDPVFEMPSCGFPQPVSGLPPVYEWLEGEAGKQAGIKLRDWIEEKGQG